jgi:hypothetical protein
MDITYTMIGADGQQYGPISLQQLRAWAGERRILPETQILRSDTNTWLPASQYVELGLDQPAVAPVGVRPVLPSQDNPQLERRVRSAARWFFWIAGLSLVNTFSASSSGGVVFVIGLGVTQLIDGFARQLSQNGTAIALAINVIAAGLFVALGLFAWKRHSWSFIVGMVLYALDALIFLIAGMWLGLAFHVFVIFWMYQGLRANMQLKAAKQGLVS